MPGALYLRVSFFVGVFPGRALVCTDPAYQEQRAVHPASFVHDFWLHVCDGGTFSVEA